MRAARCLGLICATYVGACVEDAGGVLLGSPTLDAGDVSTCAVRFSAGVQMTRDTALGAGPSWIQLDEGHLYFTTRRQGDRIRVVRRVLSTNDELEATVGSGRLAFAADARAGAVLLMADSGDEVFVEHGIHRSPARFVGRFDLAAFTSYWPDYEGGAAQLVSGYAAAFAVGGRLVQWRGSGASDVVIDGQVTSSAVDERGLAFGLNGQTGGSLVVQPSLEQRPETVLTHPGRIEHIRIEGDAVFYLQDRALMRYDKGTGESALLAAGPCGPPSVAAGRAIAACLDGERMYPELGDHLVYFDGEQTHRWLDGGYFFAPRLTRSGRVAWIQYDDPNAPCTGGPSASAQIRAAHVSRPDDIVVAATTGAPCLCCGRQWPAAELAFDGEWVAYNYAGSPSAETTIGWNRLVPPPCP